MGGDGGWDIGSFLCVFLFFCLFVFVFFLLIFLLFVCSLSLGSNVDEYMWDFREDMVEYCEL